MTDGLAYYVSLVGRGGARSSDVVYASSSDEAVRIAEKRHAGCEVLEVERDPDRDPTPDRKDDHKDLTQRVLEDFALEELEKELVLRQGAPKGSPAAEVRIVLEHELVRRARAVKEQAAPRVRDGVPELEAYGALIDRRQARQAANAVRGGAYSLRTFELGELGATPTAAEQIAADVLTTALEGGIGYWSEASRIIRRPASDDGSPGFDGFEVVAVCLDEMPTEGTKRVELPDVVRGLELVATGRAKAAHRHVVTAGALLADVKRGRESETDYDADDADVIVQAAVFGVLVYG